MSLECILMLLIKMCKLHGRNVACLLYDRTVSGLVLVGKYRLKATTTAKPAHVTMTFC